MTLPLQLSLPALEVVLRSAVIEDVPDIVTLLAGDQLAADRDGIRSAADADVYQHAFSAIEADPAHVLLVAERDGTVIGTLQLTFIPGLARRGGLRAQVEAVRVAAELRGQGLGEAMMTWAVTESRRRGAVLVQLTTDKQRTDAHRFYARLGFVATHEGMKLSL